jgi:hypothetical protein
MEHVHKEAYTSSFDMATRKALNLAQKLGEVKGAIHFTSQLGSHDLISLDENVIQALNLLKTETRNNALRTLREVEGLADQCVKTAKFVVTSLQEDKGLSASNPKGWGEALKGAICAVLKFSSFSTLVHKIVSSWDGKNHDLVIGYIEQADQTIKCAARFSASTFAKIRVLRTKCGEKCTDEVAKKANME